MGERIRQLEEALAIAHGKTSTEVHALLLQIEDGVGDRSVDTHGLLLSQNNDVIDAFGTLSIGSDGRSKYHNQSAGADVRLPVFYYLHTTHLYISGSTLLK